MNARVGWLLLIAAVVWLVVLMWTTGPYHCSPPDHAHHVTCEWR